MQTRYWALAIGVIYVVVGIAGFIPALYSAPPATPHVDVTANYGLLLGLFPVNVLHDLFHILVGVAGIAVFRSERASRDYSRALFLIYGLLAIMGFIPQANTVFGLIPIYDNDVWLDTATAIMSSYFGWVAGEHTTEPAAPVHA